MEVRSFYLVDERKRRVDGEGPKKKRNEKELGMDDALGVFDGMVSKDLDSVVVVFTDNDAIVEVHCNSYWTIKVAY